MKSASLQSGSSSGKKQTSRPTSAPAAEKSAPHHKKVKSASLKHVETVMPVPNKPRALEDKFFLDSGKARLSW
jgi:hypothetical protein